MNICCGCQSNPCPMIQCQKCDCKKEQKQCKIKKFNKDNNINCGNSVKKCQGCFKQFM